MDEKITLQELAELVEFEGGLVGLFENGSNWAAQLDDSVDGEIKANLLWAEEMFRAFEGFAWQIHNALPMLEDEDV